MTRLALGIDIGGSGVRVGLVDSDGHIRSQIAASLPPQGEPDSLAELLARLAAQVTSGTRARSEAVGVGLPGLWDRETGIMRRAVNLPWLEGLNIVDLFRRRLGPLLYVDTDVNAAAWAQWQAMNPRPERLIYVSLGTGIGGGVILHGRLVRHTHDGAGHFGFLIVDSSPQAPVGPEGLPGSLSAVAAGVVLDERAAAGALDASARMERAAQALAVALANLAHIYAPQVILLGGGVVDACPAIVSRTAAAFARYRSDLVPAELAIQRAPLSSAAAGMIGAALLALESAC